MGEALIPAAFRNIPFAALGTTASEDQGRTATTTRAPQVRPPRPPRPGRQPRAGVGRSARPRAKAESAPTPPYVPPAPEPTPAPPPAAPEPPHAASGADSLDDLFSVPTQKIKLGRRRRPAPTKRSSDDD